MKTHPSTARWNPSVAGVLIGLLTIVTFAVADKPIGVSTAVAQASRASALSYDWVAAKNLPVADLGKKRLPDIAPIPEAIWYFGLVALAGAVFAMVSQVEKSRAHPAGTTKS
ncbi:MAG: hypothetical protein ACKV19_11435 [Verrucomicrobiales bacterium]